ncbi:GNAT family N-acetyltransferase [Nocardia mexicana]|uniref:Acetyltransferase (GNAT) family protein n=1 Tax=Nocardia mexicana TaxID=279262 RepID=A0A370GY70_9NOCA|nr:GNAT family N-acetyltransferase [Nocardia mexicana]RDI48236.1 acetyltransferase (GNAT) family protein [Nocardia mexicana]
MSAERPPHVSDHVDFRRYTAEQAREIRGVVEHIFRGAYVDAIESGEPFAAPDAFMRRFDAYTARSNGFEMVIAKLGGEPVGQAWGWPLGPESRWWDGLVLDDGDRTEFTVEDGRRTFALSEIMVCKEYTGRGIARALHDELLGSRQEQRAALLVRPDNRRAYDTYLRWGWRRIGTLRPSWPDAPKFDALIHDIRG